MSTNTYTFPSDRSYDRENHMWAKADENGNVVIGIDVLGLESLGDLAYVSLLSIGDAVTRGNSAGSLEAAKMTGDIVSPVSGTIQKINESVVTNPYLVNEDPYGDGWLFVVEPSNWQGELESLVSGSDVETWSSDEIARYRKEGWID